MNETKETVKVKVSSVLIEALQDTTFDAKVIKSAIQGTNNMVCAKIVITDDNSQLVKFYALEERKATFSFTIGGKVADNSNDRLRGIWIATSEKLETGNIIKDVSLEGLMNLTYSKALDMFYNVVRPFRSESEFELAKTQLNNTLTINVGNIYVNSKQSISKFVSLLNNANLKSFIDACAVMGIDSDKYLKLNESNDI